MHYITDRNQTLNVIRLMEQELTQYERSAKAQPYFIHQRKRDIQTIKDFTQSSSEQINHLLDIIKKQALIIEMSGIQFPTINQPIELIHLLYLERMGRDVLQSSPNPSVTIPMI